jgi:hypothetical protein
MKDPKIGGCYHFTAIRDYYRGEKAPPYFLIHRDGLILALCPKIEINPNLDSKPAEIWVGAGPELTVWGKRLAFDTGAVPVYVREKDAQCYTYRGIYHVGDSKDTPDALQAAMSHPGIGALSCIVCLNPE